MIINNVVQIPSVVKNICGVKWYNRARVKLLLELSAEDSMAVVESFGTQILAEDVLPLTTRDFAEVVDSVSTDDVNQVCAAYCLLH